MPLIRFNGRLHVPSMEAAQSFTQVLKGLVEGSATQLTGPDPDGVSIFAILPLDEAVSAVKVDRRKVTTLVPRRKK